MRVLVVSDTHRYLENFKNAMDQAGKIDMIIHAGDIEDDERYIRTMLPFPVVCVAGNNDWGHDLPDEITIDLYGTKIFITHGHKYAVGFDRDLLLHKAVKEKAKIAIFGHIHQPVLYEKNGITLLNPGSLTYPRQEGHRPSYAVIDINESGKFKIKINYIEK